MLIEDKNQAHTAALYEEFRRIALNEKPDGCVNLKLVTMAKEVANTKTVKDKKFFMKMVIELVSESSKEGNISELFADSNILFDQPMEHERKELGVKLLEYIPHYY